MKKISFIIILSIFTLNLLKAQSSSEVPVKIKVVEGRYMKGVGKLDKTKTNKTRVSFSENMVQVLMPYNDKTVLLNIVNSDCKAYCPRVKRIRQLHLGDEALLKNLIKKEKENIVTQLKKSGLKI